MRKVIFSSIVVVLAGACWVLAQSSASKPFVTPYGVRQPDPPPAMLPEEKAEALTVAPGEPLVAPTTELTLPPIPQSPIAPEIAIPPRPSALPDPTLIIPNLPPAATDMAPPPLSTDAPPTPIVVPNIPVQPERDTKPPMPINTKPAIAGMPALPPIPGVASPNSFDPASAARTRYDGIVVPPATVPANLPTTPAWSGAQPSGGVVPLQPGTNPAPTQVDPPGYWQERQRLLDSVREYPERTLGPRVWGSVDYLLWFVQRQSSPPPNQGTSSSAAPGQNASQGPGGNMDILSGVRGSVGFWLNPMQTIGFEANYLWFTPNDVRDSNSIISTRQTIQIDGGEANFLFNSMRFGQGLNLIAGFRYLQINQELKSSAWLSDATSSFSASSQFDTRNQFYGGQVGLRWAYQGSRLIANVTGKIGFGAIEEYANLNGSGYAQTAGTLVTMPYTANSYHRTRTAFVPEAIVNLGYRVAPWATITFGYNFLYLTEMVRPGMQADPSANAGGVPSAAPGQPGTFTFKGDSFWVQGVNAGVTFQY